MKQKGFTLIELILYATLAAIILLSVATLFFFVMSSRVKSRTILDVDEDGRRIVRIINQAIRNAEGINAPATSTSGASLSLAFSDATKNPTIFDVSSDVLRIQEGTSTPVGLSSTSTTIVSDFSVYSLTRSGTPGAIEFQFTVSHKNLAGRNEYSVVRRFLGGASLRWP